MNFEDLDEAKGNKWGITLVFVFLTVPFLIALLEKKQDCYDSQQTCEKDWNSSDCIPHSEPNCRYLGRSYRTFGGGGSGVHSTGSSIGSISRGGFGSIGHAFGGGGE